MKLGEFRELTKDLSDDIDIILSSDEEGNSYRNAFHIDFDMKYTISRCNCSIGFGKLTQELIDDGYGDGDIMEDGEDCIVVY